MKIKHVLLAAVLMGSLSATAKDYHYTTIPGDAMKTRIYTLDNGLTVYMSVNKEKPRLQANIAVKTTMFWNLSFCTLAQFSISLFGMFST